MSLFFRARLTFIPTNSAKAAKLRKSVRSTSYLTTQPTTQSPTTEQTLVSFNQSLPHPTPPSPRPVSFSWVGISLVSFNQAWAGAGTCYTPPNTTQDHQPTWEVREPGETYPNSSGLSKEADGHKGPLLVPRLRFLIEFRQRREVHSGSLIHGHHNC